MLIVFAEEPEEEQEEIEPIKPIIRHEGTKVYQRKVPIERKVPEIMQESIRMSSLEEPTQLQDSNTLRVRDLSPKTLNSLQTKKVVDMKMGNKVVKVQKYIITKEEMKSMAKQGNKFSDFVLGLKLTKIIHTIILWDIFQVSLKSRMAKLF